MSVGLDLLWPAVAGVFTVGTPLYVMQWNMRRAQIADKRQADDDATERMDLIRADLRERNDDLKANVDRWHENIGQRLDGLAERINKVEASYMPKDDILEKITHQRGNADAKFEAIQHQLGKTNDKIENLGKDQARLGVQHDALAAGLDGIKVLVEKGFDKVDARLEKMAAPSQRGSR